MCGEISARIFFLRKSLDDYLEELLKEPLGEFPKESFMKLLEKKNPGGVFERIPGRVLKGVLGGILGHISEGILEGMSK